MTSPAYKCPACRTVLRVPQNFSGGVLRCVNPECRRKLKIGSSDRSQAAVGKSRSASPPVAERASLKKRAPLKSVAQSAPDLPPRRKKATVGRRPAASKTSNRWFLISTGGLAIAGLGIVIAAALFWSPWGVESVQAEPQPDPQAAAAAAQAAAKAAELQAEREARTTALQTKIIPFLTKHCADCHGADSQEAGITVHKLTSIDQFLAERKTWERVQRMIHVGAMPPSDYDPLPSEEDREAVAALMHDELYNFDCELVYNPGRSTVQRLNKSEYNNTIQDLFGMTLTPADNFPADDVGEGFDNIGDVLTLPPLLMEKYLVAAEEVAAAVIDTRDYSKPQMVAATFGNVSDGNSTSYRSYKVLPSTSQVEHTFDVGATGEYEVIMRVGADQAGPDKAKFAFIVGDQTIREFEVQKHREAEEFRHKLKLDAGQRLLAVKFVNDFYNAEAKGRERDRNLAVGSINLYGPLGESVPKRSDSHNRIVTVVPGKDVSVVDAAQQVLRPLMNRAFRRDVADQQVARYAGLVQMAVDDMGESYEGGLALAVQAILVAPEFLFRLEKDPAESETERALDDFEIASRLSYFLWSTMPDDTLLQLAREQRLHQPDVLREQIARMLKDEKAEALVQNFAAQWLNLRNLEEVSPDTDVFKTFNDELRRDMRRETELLFRTVMQEDRSVEELLSADFTFVNKRLAEHYGLTGVTSDEFERVSLKGTNRSGVLTHASILTLTSNPARTSPVKRGKWIMENIFGEAPPPAPPGVPELEETAKVSPDLTLREQLAKHREDPGCASCHKVMDPLGLGLENFDAVGQWRDKDGERPIDASGSLPSGEKFDGPLQLIGIVRNSREKFFRTLTEKMLTYAIGRGTEFYDKCTVDESQKLLKSRNYRFSALVEGIVLSDPFLKRSQVDKKPVSP